MRVSRADETLGKVGVTAILAETLCLTDTVAYVDFRHGEQKQLSETIGNSEIQEPKSSKSEGDD